MKKNNLKFTHEKTVHWRTVTHKFCLSQERAQNTAPKSRVAVPGASPCKHSTSVRKCSVVSMSGSS